MKQNSFKTDSQAINYVLKRFYRSEDEQDAAVGRLGKVIQDYEAKVRNLEFKLKQKGKVKDEIENKS
jgi:hypothetical protein